jgi:hypothetical protein
MGRQLCTILASRAAYRRVAAQIWLQFQLLAPWECEMTKTMDYLAMLAALAAVGALCLGMR